MESPHNQASERVRAQYETLPYPHRDPQDEQQRRICTLIDNLDAVNHYCFGGARDIRSGFRALVAGGGTGDSLLYLAEQLRHTDAVITYLDVSRSSMQVAQQRAAVCGLNNIQWLSGSLLDLPVMDLPAQDYINCSGVLHHLEDPVAGLRALRSVLKPDGGIGLMLYGQYGRTAVYQIQELMQIVNREEAEVSEQIGNTRKILQALPTNHWYNLSRRGGINIELDNDADYLDAFLHNVDRAYTVPQLYEFLDAADLHLAEFNVHYRHWYRPENLINDPELLAKLKRQPLRQRQAAGELLAGVVGRHEFYATISPLPIALFDDLENVPFFSRFSRLKQMEPQVGDLTQQSWKLKISGSAEVTIPVTPQMRAFVSRVDGQKTLEEIIESVLRSGELGMDRARVIRELAHAYEALNMCDIVLLRHKSLPALEAIASGRAA